MSQIAQAFKREMEDAFLLDRPVEQIHVTTDALEGSITTVTALYDHDDGQREIREIRVHPEDWAQLLVEKDALGRYVFSSTLQLGEPDRVFGVAVVRS